MLDHSTLISRGVTFNLCWLAIFRSLIDLTDGSLYIAFVFLCSLLLLMDVCVCLWMDNNDDKDLDLGLPKGDLVYAMEKDYPCLRPDRLFNDLMDYPLLIWNLGMIWTIGNILLHFDGLFMIEWTVILRWIVTNGMDTLTGLASWHGKW